MPAEIPPAASAPKGARKTPVPDPVFTDNTPAVHDSEVMDVNPTSREDLAAKGAGAPAREYIADPYGGKGGPAHLSGPDLARSGGGADQRIDDRQAKLAEKFRLDPGVKKLLADEAKKKFGVLPDDAPVDSLAGDLPSDDTAADPPTTAAVEVAKIAALEREKRELKAKLKDADGARSAAKRLEMYKEIAKDYPLAAVKALLGVDADALYDDDVKGKSKSVGDKYLNLDPAKALETDDAVGAKDRELQAERAEAARLRVELAERNLRDQVAGIARGDGKRWELCLREPNIGAKVAEKARSMYREAKTDAEREGLKKIWSDDKLSVDFTHDLLDELEKEYDAVGKRFSRASPGVAAAGASKRPVPPAGQRPAGGARPVEHDRYARPAKRESVEDRQDKLIAKYSGTSFTE